VLSRLLVQPGSTVADSHHAGCIGTAHRITEDAIAQSNAGAGKPLCVGYGTDGHQDDVGRHVAALRESEPADHSLAAVIRLDRGVTNQLHPLISCNAEMSAAVSLAKGRLSGTVSEQRTVTSAPRARGGGSNLGADKAGSHDDKPGARYQLASQICASSSIRSVWTLARPARTGSVRADAPVAMTMPSAFDDEASGEALGPRGTCGRNSRQRRPNYCQSLHGAFLAPPRAKCV